MTQRMPAEAFSPGEILREELKARGWTQGDLASMLGLTRRFIHEVITDQCALTPETAKGLSEVLGTSVDFWINLQESWEYRLGR